MLQKAKGLSAAARAAPKLINWLKPMDNFGADSLMEEVPCPATIVAKTKVVAWMLSRAAFESKTEELIFKRRKAYSLLLEKVPLMQSLGNSHCQRLADALLPLEYEAGQTLASEEEDRCAYKIISCYKCIHSSSHNG